MPRQSVQMTISLSPDLYRKALDVAKKEIRSKSEVVREALREYVGRRESVLAARKSLARALARKGADDLETLERLVDSART